MNDQSSFLQKRNQLIIYIYLTFLLIYITVVSFDEITLNETFFVSSCVTLLIYLIFKNTVLPERIIQIYILITLNVLILLLICKTFYIINLYLFIFYLLLVSIYFSSKLLIAFSIIVMTEIYLITYVQFFKDISTKESIYLYWAIASVLVFNAVLLIVVNYLNWHLQEKRLLEKRKDNISKNAYLNLFFESANDAIAVFDTNNKIIAINPAFEKLYGWTKSECIGKSLPLTPPEFQHQTKERFNTLLEGKSITMESDEMKKDGTIFKAQISLSPIFDKDGHVLAVSVISRDISFKKEHERLQLQSEKLQLAGEIAAGVAHEIRNPMTVISGFAQMMEMDEKSPFKDYIPIVKDEIERINLIISEFLVLSKPQIKDKEWINLNTIIEEVSTFFALEFKAKSINFKYISNFEDAFIFGNKNQLKQVFINLVKNSLEAIELNGSIEISLQHQNNGYLLSIKDDGCGIPEDVLARIFEPFYTTKVKGTGLGMMIIHKIVQDHYGSIKVFSKENVGTDIHIQFSTDYSK